MPEDVPVNPCLEQDNAVAAYLPTYLASLAHLQELVEISAECHEEHPEPGLRSVQTSGTSEVMQKILKVRTADPRIEICRCALELMKWNAVAIEYHVNLLQGGKAK